MLSDRIAQLSEERKRLLARALQIKSVRNAYPTSFAQHRLWLVDELNPGNASYNMPTALRLLGYLDLTSLQQSFDAIMQRHAALRTTFVAVDGQPFQVIARRLGRRYS